MRKGGGRPISIDKIWKKFSDRIKEIEGFYDSGSEAFSSRADHKKRKMISEHSLLAAAVAWERFLNDLLIAYMKKDSRKLKKTVEENVERERQKWIFDAFVVTMNIPHHFSKSQVKTIIDKGGRNLAFPKYQGAEKHARKYIARRYADNLKLPEADKAVINLLIALRNQIAHESPKSYSDLKEALEEEDLDSNFQRGKGKRFPRKAGAYLEAKAPGSDQARILIIFSSLKKICDHLCSKNLSSSPQRTRRRTRRGHSSGRYSRKASVQRRH